MATKKDKSAKTLFSVEENLYRFILDDYDQHAMLEAAVVSIAKARSKRTFPKDKAVKVIGVVVSNAHRWYHRHIRNLPRLRPEVKANIAGHLYNTEENHIKRLTSYYKNVKTN